MFVKQLQLPGAHRFAGKMGGKLGGVISVGARQRYQDPIRRPGRDRARQNMLQNLFRQRLQQIKTTLDIRLVPTQTPADLAQAEAQTAVQLLDQPGLLDRFPAPLTALNQQVKNGLALRASRHRDQPGIAAQVAQGRKTLITVNQNQLSSLTGYRQHCLKLPVPGDRLR